MAIEFPHYDNLNKGVGYQPIACPTTDVSPAQNLGATLPMDSTNPTESFQTVSIATEAVDGPENPAPYWNSGEKETLGILE